MAGKNSSKDATPAGPVEGEANLDQVRNILFGNQQRELEKRIHALEERWNREHEETREDARRRIESLETYVKGEVNSLMDKIKAEARDRKETFKEVTRDLRDLQKSLEKRLSSLDNSTDKSSRELREQLLEQSNSLRDEIRQVNAKISEAIDREVSALDDRKVTRGALAEMFTEVALRLNGDGGLPLDGE